MVFIQESKLQGVNSRTIQFLEGKSDYKGEWVSSIGASGGLISLWDDNFFSMECKVVSHRYILLEGTIKSRMFKCGFGNIYTPNDDKDRQVFWEELGDVLKGREFHGAWVVILT